MKCLLLVLSPAVRRYGSFLYNQSIRYAQVDRRTIFPHQVNRTVQKQKQSYAIVVIVGPRDDTRGTLTYINLLRSTCKHGNVRHGLFIEMLQRSVDDINVQNMAVHDPHQINPLNHPDKYPMCPKSTYSVNSSFSNSGRLKRLQ